MQHTLDCVVMSPIVPQEFSQLIQDAFATFTPPNPEWLRPFLGLWGPEPPHSLVSDEPHPPFVLQSHAQKTFDILVFRFLHVRCARVGILRYVENVAR